jgi:hypothetical protein
MPRIRSWQDLHMFRPDTVTHYEHIDSSFTASIDWKLIEAHPPPTGTALQSRRKPWPAPAPT